MTAVRETILQAVEAAIIATHADEVERMPSGDPASFPAVHIYDDGQGDDAPAEAGTVQYTMELQLEGFVERAGGSAAAGELNALYAAVVKAIMALEDPALGIVDIVERRMRVKVAPLASARRLAFELDFDITFVTRRGDPETF